MSFIEGLLSAFGGAAVALAVAAYLGRRFLDIQVSRVTEKYKADLEQKSAILKTELSIYAHEQNVGISRLDQQRSDAIRAIFGLVTKWHEVYLEIIKPNEPNIPPESQAKRYCDLSKALVKVAEEISVVSRDSAIYFQETSYEIIGRFGMAAMELSCAFYDNTFGKLDCLEGSNSVDELLRLIAQERNILAEKSMDGFEQASTLLIHEFRLLMKAER